MVCHRINQGIGEVVGSHETRVSHSISQSLPHRIEYIARPLLDGDHNFFREHNANLLKYDIILSALVSHLKYDEKLAIVFVDFWALPKVKNIFQGQRMNSKVQS